MNESATRRFRFAAWFEKTSRPGIILIALILIFYAPSLLGGFMIDDHRLLRIMAEYHAGSRSRPAAYEFLFGDGSNAQERIAGNYAWWMDDALRYRHFRPAAEWLLYAEYRVFGEHALGYRLVSLAMYSASVLLLLQFFRAFMTNEALARWAALIFTLMASHAIPVIFISAQCDVLALLGVAVATLSLARFLQAGSAVQLLVGTAFLLLALGSKEAVLPVIATPLLLMMRWPRDPGFSRRRAVVAACIWIFLGLAWLSWYAAHGYGANNQAMLDPIGDPLNYLRLAPVRAMILIASWILVVNPFLIEINHNYQHHLWIYPLVAVPLLLIAAASIWRWHRRSPVLLPAILWSLMFLPVLACTPPDDRVMMLPSIGLAMIGALWLVRGEADAIASELLTSDQSERDALASSPSRRLNRLPVLIFLVVQPAAILITTGIINFMELEAQRHLRMMAGIFGRTMTDDDCIFIINSSRAVESLFTQDRFRRAIGQGHVAVLSDLPHPHVSRLDDHTLRIVADEQPMLASFLGRMGTRRDRPRHTGETVRAREFTARIADTRDGAVLAVDLTFRDPLDSERYRFFQLPPASPPVSIKP